MSACGGCKKELGPGSWERAKVVKRETGPGIYFLVPKRTWLLEAGTVQAYMVGTTLLCTDCYQAQEEAPVTT